MTEVVTKPVSRRLRFMRAYWTAIMVLGSYLKIKVLSRFFGPSYAKRKLPQVHRRNAARVETTVLTLRGLFIKVGQLISIMTNFLPEEFRKPLERLQDQVPPRPFEDVQSRVESELGGPLSSFFSTFDQTPIASASLGQVHRAELPDGTQVAVKVQHGDIDDIVAIDLRTIWKILLLVSRFFPLKGLDVVYRQLKTMILAELDFVREAKFIELIGKNLSSEEKVRVPKLFADLSTARVLTISYEQGVKISNLDQLTAWELDRRELADRLVRTYCQMVFVDGVYHADPHPGNLLVQEDGTLVLLDFGAVAELSGSMKDGIPRFLEAVLRRDPQAIHRELRLMGFIAHGHEAEEASERIVEYFQQKFQEELHLESLNLRDIRFDPQKGMENLIDLKRKDIGIREMMNAFQVPKDWVLLERTLILIAGVCTHLDPGMNPMATVRPYLEEFVLGEGKDLSSLVVNALRESGLSALSVPTDLRRYLKKVMRNELETRVRGLGEHGRLLYAGMHQMLYGGAAITLLILGLEERRADPQSTVMWGLLAASAFLGLLLLASMFRARRYCRK